MWPSQSSPKISSEILFSDISLDLSPQYIESGESFTLTCTVSGGQTTTVSRVADTCVLGCSPFDTSLCDQTDRTFDINCEGNKVIVSVNPAVENDFTTWACGVFNGGSDSEQLQKFSK